MIAMGVLADRAIEQTRGVLVNPRAAETLDAARRVLDIDERQHADLESEMLSMLRGVAGQPQPTLRLRSATLH